MLKVALAVAREDGGDEETAVMRPRCLSVLLGSAPRLSILFRCDRALP